MTLKSYAQEQFVMDPMSPASQLPASDTHAVSEVHHHHHFPELQGDEKPHGQDSSLEVTEPVEIEIIIDDLPGAPPNTKDPEPILEVAEEPINVKDDDNDLKKAKDGKNEKWNWEAHGPHGFVAWIKARIADVPKHSGYDSAGLERAMAFMDRLDNEISKAMRMDLDGELDANQIEKVRAELDDGISRLQARLEKVKQTKKSKRKKKSEYEIDEDGFIKEAQKITGVQGVYVTVPLLISSIARICVNGMVSAGHDVEDMYNNLSKKYALTNREQLELRQLLFDMGMPMRIDMGMEPEEDLEVSDSNNYNWQTNYRG